MDSNKLPYRLLSGCDMDKLTIIDYPGQREPDPSGFELFVYLGSVVVFYCFAYYYYLY